MRTIIVNNNYRKNGERRFAIFAYDKEKKERVQLSMDSNFESCAHSLEFYKRNFNWCKIFKIQLAKQITLFD